MSDENLVAIVTGSAQGLGYAIVKELLNDGFKVCVSDINEEKGNASMEDLQNEFGEDKVIFHVCDVTQKTQIEDVFKYTLEKFERLDLLVNNAGTVNEVEPEKTVAINVMGVIYGCDLAFKYMGKDQGGNGGMVLNVSSIAGIIPSACAPVYVATKHAIVGLTRSYGDSYHYDRSGIIFCALCPFFIDTPLLLNFKTLSLVPGLDVTTRPDLMTPEYAAKGAMKLISDKQNGATLVVTEEERLGYKYVGIGELADFEA